jgi:hypothetical protein
MRHEHKQRLEHWSRPKQTTKIKRESDRHVGHAVTPQGRASCGLPSSSGFWGGVLFALP